MAGNSKQLPAIIVHLKCESISDREPTMWCTVSSPNWKGSVRLHTSTWKQNSTRSLCLIRKWQKDSTVLFAFYPHPSNISIWIINMLTVSSSDLKCILLKVILHRCRYGNGIVMVTTPVLCTHRRDLKDGEVYYYSVEEYSQPPPHHQRRRQSVRHRLAGRLLLYLGHDAQRRSNGEEWWITPVCTRRPAAVSGTGDTCGRMLCNTGLGWHAALKQEICS